MTRLALILLAVLPGCAVQENSLKRDLVGHTMGGRENAWHFQSTKQIKQLKVLEETKNGYVIDLILHDDRVSGIWHAKARLTYKGRRLETVGLLFIDKLRHGGENQ